MPSHKSAEKRLRTSKKKRGLNRKAKSELKRVALKLRKAVSSKNQEEAKEALREAVSRLDKAAAKGIIHKNTAARKKSRLSRKLAGHSA